MRNLKIFFVKFWSSKIFLGYIPWWDSHHSRCGWFTKFGRYYGDTLFDVLNELEILNKRVSEFPIRNERQRHKQSHSLPFTTNRFGRRKLRIYQSLDENLHVFSAGNTHLTVVRHIRRRRKIPEEDRSSQSHEKMHPLSARFRKRTSMLRNLPLKSETQLNHAVRHRSIKKSNGCGKWKRLQRYFLGNRLCYWSDWADNTATGKGGSIRKRGISAYNNSSECRVFRQRDETTMRLHRLLCPFNIHYAWIATIRLSHFSDWKEYNMKEKCEIRKTQQNREIINHFSPKKIQLCFYTNKICT